MDIIDCQSINWQLIEIVKGIGAWQIIAIIDCFFSNKNNWVYIRTIIVVFIQLSDWIPVVWCVRSHVW